MRAHSRKGSTVPHGSLWIIFGVVAVGWLMPAPTASPGQQSGEIEAAVASPVDMHPRTPLSKRELVALADPEVAHRHKLSPEQYRRIAVIDTELDRNARQAMQKAIEQWQKRGGFHVEAIPNFRDPLSPYGQQLKLLKQAAEDQIAKVLSSAELNQWQEEARPMPGKSAERFVQATL